MTCKVRYLTREISSKVERQPVKLYMVVRFHHLPFASKPVDNPTGRTNVQSNYSGTTLEFSAAESLNMSRILKVA